MRRWQDTRRLCADRYFNRDFESAREASSSQDCHIGSHDAQCRYAKAVSDPASKSVAGNAALVEQLFQVVLYRLVCAPVQSALADFTLDKFVTIFIIFAIQPKEFVGGNRWPIG